MCILHRPVFMALWLSHLHAPGAGGMLAACVGCRCIASPLYRLNECQCQSDSEFVNVAFAGDNNCALHHLHISGCTLMNTFICKKHTKKLKDKEYKKHNDVKQTRT